MNDGSGRLDDRLLQIVPQSKIRQPHITTDCLNFLVSRQYTVPARENNHSLDDLLRTDLREEVLAHHTGATRNKNGVAHQCSIKVAAQFAPKPKLKASNLSPGFNRFAVVASLRLIQLSAAMTWPFWEILVAKSCSFLTPMRSSSISQLR